MLECMHHTFHLCHITTEARVPCGWQLKLCDRPALSDTDLTPKSLKGINFKLSFNQKSKRTCVFISIPRPKMSVSSLGDFLGYWEILSSANDTHCQRHGQVNPTDAFKIDNAQFCLWAGGDQHLLHWDISFVVVTFYKVVLESY